MDVFDEDPPNLGGRPSWEPTEKERISAETMAGYGVPWQMIATLLGVSRPTLMKYLTPELETGKAKATVKVTQTLFLRATVGNDLGAMIFWLKAQAGWREKHPDDDGDDSKTLIIRGGLPD